MLPFLKNKQRTQTGIVQQVRSPDTEENQEDSNPDASIEACAQDLIDAVHAKDVKAASEAIKAAFEILDSQPHEEGEHISPHTYEDQKED